MTRRTGSSSRVGVTGLLVLLLVLTAVPAGAAPTRATAPPPAGQPPTPTATADTHVTVVVDGGLPGAVDLPAGTSRRGVAELGIDRLRVPAAAVDGMLRGLRARGIEARVDTPVAAVRQPSDPVYGSQWAFPRTRSEAAWDLTTGSPGTIIAVIDTGVLFEHPDLAGATVAGRNFIDPSLPPADDAPDGHGTSVTGAIAARSGNGIGGAGMCWGCRVMPLKVLDRDGLGTASVVAEAIHHAVDHGASVINLSLTGYARDAVLARAVEHAIARDVVVVAAAGNQGGTQVGYPAGYPGVLSVGASGPDDGRYGFSNHGSWVDVAAPGCIATTGVERGVGVQTEFCGTSAAAPLVAGVAGLIRSWDPTVTAAEVVAAIAASADPIGDWVAHGRVNTPAALVAATGRAPGVPLVGDWNGDGHVQPGWWRSGRWALDDGRGGLIELVYGRAQDAPVVGDWNGDGRDEIGIIRDREWHLNDRLAGGSAKIVFTYGRMTRGDRPLVGDWNGDGRDEIGIVRDREWHLRYRLSGGPADRMFVYGRVTAGDVPVIGDWNGDGADTVGIVRGNDWHLRYALAGGPADGVFAHGGATPGEVPVVGDWDGVGSSGIGVVRGTSWHLRDRANRAGSDTLWRFTGF